MEATESIQMFAERIMRYDSKKVVQMMRTVHEPTARSILACRLMMDKTPEVVAVPTVTFEKSRKALNAYMGYRCYYKNMPLFDMWPMKKISFYMGQLWEQEPDKPLWTLMAKAWSAIRDQVGKANAPLDEFFEIVCTHLNILPPQFYLEGQGWKVEYDGDGMPTLTHDPTSSLSASLGYGFKGDTLSMEEITSVCLDRGYGIGYVSDENAASPTFLGYNIQAMRNAARNKRRARRQTARDSPAAETLRQGYIDFCDAIPQSALRDDRRDPKLYGHILDILSRYDVSAPAETAEAPTENAGEISNSAVAVTTSDMISNNVFVPTDMSAFRVGANANATLPSYEPNNFLLG